MIAGTCFYIAQSHIIQNSTVIADDITYNKLGKYLSRECSDAESRYIESLLRDNPDIEVLAGDLQKLWEAKKKFIPFWDVEESWGELDEILHVDTIEIPQK